MSGLPRRRLPKFETVLSFVLAVVSIVMSFNPFGILDYNKPATVVVSDQTIQTYFAIIGGAFLLVGIIFAFVWSEMAKRAKGAAQ